MLLIALTGGIGSGKTTVSNIFESQGAPIIDTDTIARDIVEQGKPAYLDVIKAFGKEVLLENKDINRKKLAQIIFSSKTKKTQLESILHPIIWNEVESRIAVLSASKNLPPYSIIVVPLLFENSVDEIPVSFDRILVIDTDEESQLLRTIKRDNSDESNVKRVINSQVKRNIRTEASDDIILNTGNLASLEKKVLKLHEQYKNMAE